MANGRRSSKRAGNLPPTSARRITSASGRTGKRLAASLRTIRVSEKCRPERETREFRPHQHGCGAERPGSGKAGTRAAPGPFEKAPCRAAARIRRVLGRAVSARFFDVGIIHREPLLPGTVQDIRAVAAPDMALCHDEGRTDGSTGLTLPATCRSHRRELNDPPLISSIPYRRYFFRNARIFPGLLADHFQSGIFRPGVHGAPASSSFLYSARRSVSRTSLRVAIAAVNSSSTIAYWARCVPVGPS